MKTKIFIWVLLFLLGVVSVLADTPVANNVVNFSFSNITVLLNNQTNLEFNSTYAINNTVAVNFTTNGTWTAPDLGVSTYNVTVQLIGAGGGGGGRLSTCGSGGAGGGGGGSYSTANITVTGGQTYNVTVGDKGIGGIGSGLSNGTTGGDSWFINTTTILAKGGGFGQGCASRAGGRGGNSSQNVGTIKYDGGNGADGKDTTTYYSGGGGGGAGTTGAGGNTTDNTAGLGTSLYGGNGGVGRTTNGIGNNGNNYGGGGSGAYEVTGSTVDGGNGTGGIVIIIYNNVTVVSNSCTYSGSGNWVINISDNCNISTSNNLGRANLTLNGSTNTNDRLYITGSIFNFSNYFVTPGTKALVWGRLG